MKYVVEVCYGNRNEWSNEIDHYVNACDYAREMSELAGVSEARVYSDCDVLLDVYVNGEDAPLPLGEEDEWAEYDEPNYPFDEWGYDPYTGGFDADL